MIKPLGKMSSRVGLVSAAFLLTASLQSQPFGQWDFDKGDLSATVGSALQFTDGAGATTSQQTRFGTTTSFGIPDIGGASAQVMRFPAAIAGMGFNMPTPAAANGGGGLVNNWTLLLDVLFPTESDGKVRALIDSDGGLINADSELFVGANGGLGGNGQFDGKLLANTWYRIGFAVSGQANTIEKYINGVRVGVQPAGGLDGRWALATGATALLFGDDNDQTAVGYVNSIQLRNVALTKAQMLAFAGPAAAGIPRDIPPIPSFLEQSIPPTAFAGRSTDIGFILDAGDTTIQDSSISLKLDGAVVAGPSITRNGKLITVRKSGNNFAIPSRHTIELSYSDSLKGQQSVSHRFDVVVFYEDFDGLKLEDSVDELAGTPAVWTKTPPTDWKIDNSKMPGVDDDGVGRTEWEGWSFANKDFWIRADDQTRSTFTLGRNTLAIADPDEWDDRGAPVRTVGYFNSFLNTPSISIEGLPAGSVVVRFDSSWRPEGLDDAGPDGQQTNNQTATVSVSFDGGAPIQILKYDSDPKSATYKGDSQSESVTVEAKNPAGAKQMVLTFGLTNAGNDWWWAFDNLVITARSEGPKPGTPIVALPPLVTLFDVEVPIAGSAFVGINKTDVNVATVVQVSANPAFSANTGLSSRLISVTLTNGATTLSIPTSRLFAGVNYYVTMQYQDQAGNRSDFSEPVAFTLTTPANPIVLETFESVADYGIPNGWTRSNQTDVATAGLDPRDPNSDTYLDWTVVPIDILAGFGGGRADNTNVVSGKSIYAESDNRSGNQIQHLVTSNFNLGGKSNIWVAFKSNYVQNQDSLGALEYSVDSGKTWLPILYLLDDKPAGGDVVRAGGAIDATATLTTTAGDIAKVMDPATGARVDAGKYADFILAQPISSLGPYISGRIDDDKNESRRYERFRLSAADGKATVQFRFVQAGTGSWWWGIDDFGIYSVAPSGPLRTKPETPAITLPATLTILDAGLSFTGSAFAGVLPSDANAQTVLQISASSVFTATAGLTNVLVAATNSTGATVIAATSERLFPGQTYYATMQYQDKTGLKSDFAAPVSFTISPLPTPIAIETFESTTDFGVPAGWTATNQTDTATAGADPASPVSDIYKNWVVVPFSTLVAFGGGRADYTNVVSGKSIYAESDNRGANQIQVLLSPEYNLSGRINVWVAFKSSYVQNQDSLGALEYTVDGGNTWLPLIYMINDKPSNTDIVRTNGVINASATLTTTAGDIAKIIDPATGQRVAAGKYADFILAKPIESLGPYISGRIDDDKAESRRYERFRLTAADNQAKVRFRLVQAGTGSWWWGIDDFALYGSGEAAAAALAAARQGNNVVISWTASGTLQSADTVTGLWTDVPGAKSPQSVAIAGPGKFYRLRP